MSITNRKGCYTVIQSYLRSCAIICPKRLKKPENWSTIIFILLDKNRKREFLNMKEDCKPLPLILIMVLCVCLHRGLVSNSVPELLRKMRALLSFLGYLKPASYCVTSNRDLIMSVCSCNC